MTTYNISIQNPKEIPWLDLMELREKTYEGRLNRGVYSKMMIGDSIIFKDQNNKILHTHIIDLKYYLNFGEAFLDLGRKLVPVEGVDVDGVKKLYSNYFSEDNIKLHGVVAIGIIFS